uniref:Non-specific serine/threonine protein kinase n=1 Tax=Panagrolaimus superbus TaxID=310955 RepID=A0A914YNL7_9BILA
MLVEFIYGKLPWRDVKSKKICQVKEDSFATLFRHGPVELYAVVDHIQTLKYETRPNYDYLREIISTICTSRNFKFSDPYDWEAGGESYETFEQLKNSYSTTSGTTRTTTASPSPQSRSQKVENFEKPKNEESFVEILEQQPSPPAEKFTDFSVKKKPEDDEHFEDAKDDTKKN